MKTMTIHRTVTAIRLKDGRDYEVCSVPPDHAKRQVGTIAGMTHLGSLPELTNNLPCSCAQLYAHTDLPYLIAAAVGTDSQWVNMLWTLTPIL